jgi:outer membrane porin, OprD family
MSLLNPIASAQPRVCVRCCLVLALAVAFQALAGQEALTENPPPATPQEVTTPLEQSFEPAPPPQSNAISDAVDQALEHLPPFVRDTQLVLKLRTYYFDQDLTDGKESKAWAGGGSLAYTSGWLAERFRFGAEVFTSQPIYAPEEQDGTLLLAPGQEGYTVWGQAYGQLKIIDDSVLTAGRSEYNTPYANRQFNRMTPNTFEGVSLKGSLIGLQANSRIDYLVGYLSDIKLRNSDEFIPMSKALGPADNYYGTAVAEIKYAVESVSAGIAEYYTPQNLNIVYVEANWTPQFGSKYGLKFSGQYTDEQSIGGAVSLGGNPAHSNAGVRASFGGAGFVFNLAYSYTSSDGNIISVWGINPSYTNGLVKNRNRAGEQGGMGSVSYDFANLGAAGLSASALYAHGWSAVNPSTKASLPDQHEVDLTLDYRVQKTMFKGLWLRVQRLFVQAAGEAEPGNEWRIILNWDIPLI